MKLDRTILVPLAALFVGAATAPGAEFRVDNTVGGVAIRIIHRGRFELRQINRTRPAQLGDVQARRESDVVHIECAPKDGATVDLELDIPFGLPIQVKTRDGKIALTGFPSSFTAQTVTGEIEVTAPWVATKFLLVSAKPPKELDLPRDVKFRRRRDEQFERERWLLEDRHDELTLTYGHVRIHAERSRKVTLRSQPIPDEAAVKMPWQAKPVVARLIGEGRSDAPARARTDRDQTLFDAPPKRQPPGAAQSAPAPAGMAVFSSDVRMVSLPAAVYDARGTPLAGLTAQDFEVLEDGEPQRIEAAESEDAPFNLAILLDLSFSTSRDREQMKRSAQRFLGIARPRDHVAAYALANNWFGVIAPLTANHTRVAEAIERLPKLAGGSPIYDAMILAYAEDLEARRGERNALIVISDGIDNRIGGIGVPSKTSYKELLRSAERMDALIYPVFLGPSEEQMLKRSYPHQALQRFKSVAAATGGRVFETGSIEGMESVYEQVAAELRSVYTISYYPTNQSFDGQVRRVEVRAKKPGAVVRSRESYLAR